MCYICGLLSIKNDAMSLCIENVSKFYGEHEVLNHINLSLKEGEIVGFLGPNGAGKSTLMKIVTGYITPTAGQVTIYGNEMRPDTIEAKRLIGYLPEHNPLYLEMYVTEYLYFVAECYHLGKDKSRRIDEMIERTGLVKEQRKKIGQLSKGYRQRVGLAQAMIHDPKVLILDEPTTGLDPNQLIEIRELIREVGKDKTVLFSTHIMQEVKALCQRIVVINQGSIVADAAANDIIFQKEHQVFEVEFSTSADILKSSTIEGILDVESMDNNSYRIFADRDIREELFKFTTKEGLTLLTMRQVEESMEDTFRRLTQKEQ